MKSPLKRITHLLQPDRSDLWIIGAYSVAIGLLTLALPVASQSLINTVAFGTVLQPLIVLSLLLFAALVAASTLQGLRHWLVEVVQQRLFVRVTGEAGERLIRARSSFFDNVHGPELVNRFLDVAIVQKSVAVLLIDGLTIFMQTVAGLLLLAVYHPLLLVFDGVLFLMILLILFGLGRGAVRTSIAESQAKYEVLAWLEELARHRSTFRSTQGASFGWSRTNTLALSYIRERRSHFRVELRQIIGSLLLQAFALSALLGFGGYLVTKGQLTLGQLVAGELVVGMVVSGFTKLNKSLESYYDLSAAADEIGCIEDLPTEENPGSRMLQTGTGAVLQLTGVGFRFEAGPPLFREVNLSIGAGERIALQGDLDSGRSTLLDIVAGLRVPDTGHIEIDAQDYRELSPEGLRTHVALVRSIEVFAGTVLENLTLGADLDNKLLHTVLERTGLQATIAALPDGVHTRLATGGAPLKRHHALRLMVARALLSRASVLLVDGVLDALAGIHLQDPLVRTLFAPDAPWILVVTTDRQDLQNLCGRVYRLSDGTLSAVSAGDMNDQENSR